MWVDLISTNNMGYYNIKFAEMFGLHEAIYLSEILNQYEEANRNNLADKDNFFECNRDNITRRTTLLTQEQIDIDEKFINAGIIIQKKKGDINIIKIDFPKLLALAETEEKKILKTTEKIFKSKSKYYKQESLANYCKQSIKVQDEELRAEYEKWIDAVIAKDGTLLPINVEDAEEVVNNYSKKDYGNDFEMALNLIHISAIHAYRDMRWSIKLLEKYGR